MTELTNTELAGHLEMIVGNARWFAGGPESIAGIEVLIRESLTATTDGDDVELVVAAVRSVSGVGQLYQIPVLVHTADDEHVVSDALASSDAIEKIGSALGANTAAGDVSFHTVAGAPPVDVSRVHPLGADQSNTSVVFGDSTLLKVFRRPEPGENPDVEVHRALTAVGCDSVAPLHGWIEANIGGVATTLAMAQAYARNSSDGWIMALTSVRDLLAEGDLFAEEVGTDFAGESHRLGATVARVHTDLRSALGTATSANPVERFDDVLRQFDDAIGTVPGLAAYRRGAEKVVAEAIAEASASSQLTVRQRIHGDLHLGQVLRTPSGWLVIDFEGEPAKSIAERRAPDSPLRDVAGMLRSFDYAAHQQILSEGPSSSFLTERGAENQSAFRAREWARRNRDAFCEGYAATAGTDPRATPATLRVYELEKAVYETVYEAHHRPSWVSLPLKAIDALVGGAPGAQKEGPR